MPFIVITVNDDGTGISVSVNPRQATAQPSNRQLTWILQAGSSGWNWASNGGIVLSTDPPSSIYAKWPTDNPAQPGPGNSYVATAPDLSGGPILLYKYTINLLNAGNSQTMRIDPDIANDPQG